jgi:hypothetical protein
MKENVTSKHAAVDQPHLDGLPITTPERAVFMLTCLTVPSVLEAVCGNTPATTNVFRPHQSLQENDRRVENLCWGFCFARVNDLIETLRKNKKAFEDTAKIMDGTCNNPPFCTIKFHSDVLPSLLPDIKNPARCVL